ADLDWLEKSFSVLSGSFSFDKVYLETFRDNVLVDRDLMLRVKSFFNDKGVETSGGIATYLSSGLKFQSLCYSKPEDREKLWKATNLTAMLFDEIILDDFFFTSCRCEECVKAKGDKSWTEHRLKLMETVSEGLIKKAKEVNQKVKLVIKYPNWYDHYQYLGYNLESESRLFDMIYTGTETRDPEYTHQHLQEYQSYAIMRFLENVKPGGNGGGWVDPFARRTLNRYAEQIRLTLFAKAKEVTLFCFGALIEMVTPPNGIPRPTSQVASIAGKVFEEMDPVLSMLGKPYGVPSYKPYHSSGEDFLHNYIGMLGIPMEITPRFPEEIETVFLTECAKFDKDIIRKIQTHLLKGGNIIITSGFLKALQDDVSRDLVEVQYTDRRVLVNEFSMFTDTYHSDIPILIPQLKYATNDSWEMVTCLSRGNGYPLLLQTSYAGGTLYILTVPDNFNDLYHLPSEVINELRRVFISSLKIRLEGPSRICIFLYDNDTFVIHSFMPHFTKCSVVVKKSDAKLYEPALGTEIKGFERNSEAVFTVFLQPYSYRVFKIGT
ncbi:MAG: permease, partial [Thermoproteota archaeon]